MNVHDVCGTDFHLRSLSHFQLRPVATGVLSTGSPTSHERMLEAKFYPRSGDEYAPRNDSFCNRTSGPCLLTVATASILKKVRTYNCGRDK